MVRTVKGAIPLPTHKPMVPEGALARSRKKAILDDYVAGFEVLPNSHSQSKKPWYALDYFSEVKGNEKTIDREAKKAGIDSDLVKAIVYLETTQGYYDRVAPPGLHKTVRPMNIHADYWKGLGVSKSDLKKPAQNIRTGIRLLKRIKEEMPEASIAQVATVYNSLDATHVSDYGSRVEELFKTKPWER